MLRTCTLEKLAQLATARAADQQLVPAVGPLAAARLTALDLQPGAAVELASKDPLQLRLAERTEHAHAELARECVHAALQARGELAAGREQLEPSNPARHGTYRDEAPAEAPRQPLGHCCPGGLRWR